MVSGLHGLHRWAGTVLGPDSPLVDRRLENGARVLCLPTPGDPDRSPVAIELWILGGTSAETAQEHGCAHLLEHMLFKPAWIPTRVRPGNAEGRASDIASAIESLGGDVNAFTSHDETVFHATVPAAAVSDAMSALVCPVVGPRLDSLELQREIGVVVEEIKQYDDDPASRVVQDLLEALYGEHSYARPVLGRAVEVQSHDANRLKAFHRRLFTAQRAVLVVVGPVDPEAILARAEVLLAPLPRRGRLPKVESPRPPSRPRIRVCRDAVHEVHLALGWQGPRLPDPEGCALEVASVALGYGEASRLVTGTRRGTRSVTDAHASFYAARLGSTLVVTANTTARRTEAAVADLLEQIDRLRRIPIDEEELARARAVLCSDVVYRRETVSGLSHALGYQLSLCGDLESERRYFEALEGLTPDAVRQACERHLRPGSTALSMVVPRSAFRDVSSLRSKIESAVRRPARSRPGKLTRKRKAGITRIDLPGGLRIRAKVDRSVPMAAGWLVWPGGLRIEPARDAGASALMAELLTRGCEAIDGDALAREVDGFAAVLEGFAGRNSIGMHFECLSPHVDTLLRRMVDCVLAPTFDPEELDEERRVALEELDAEGDDLAGTAFRTAHAALYRNHPFQRRRRGTRACLQRLTSSRLHRLWDAYPIGRAVLGLCGDVDLEAIVRMLEALLPSGRRPARMPKLPGGAPRYPKRPAKRRVVRVREQAHVVLAFPGLTLDDPRVWPLDVLTGILGGQAGRLFEALRERRGLVYGVSVSSAEGLDAGHLAVHASTSRAQHPQALAAIWEELERLVDSGPTRQELARTKAWLVGQHEVETQRRGRVAASLAFDEVYGLGVEASLRYPKRIEAVTRQDVTELARTLLDPRRCVTTIVG